MDKIRLSQTDLDVSRICFGSMTFGGQTDEAGARRMVDLCFDRGINFFDTANMYTKGSSEEMLGRLLKGRRDRAVIATKVRAPMGDQPGMSGLSRDAIRRALEDSLRRLGMDYVDIYYLHWPDREVPIEETLAAMNELVREGRVRYPGASNYAAWQLAQMHCLAPAKGWRPPWITQPMYNLLARGIEQEYLEMCRGYGISSFVYNPLAGGLLTGKQKAEAPLPGTRFDNNRMYLDRYWHAQYFEAVEALKAIAGRSGRSLISLALCWLYYNSGIEGIILGASRVEHLEQNLDCLQDGPLDALTVEACGDVWKKLRGPAPAYNR